MASSAQLLNNAPIPKDDPIGKPRPVPGGGRPDPMTGVFVTDAWINYLTTLSNQVSQGATQIGGVAATSQSAAIAASPLSGPISAGLYRATYYFRISQPAGLSSSLRVDFHFIDGGVACTFQGVAAVGNTVDTIASQTVMLRSDAPGPITFSTTYTSVPASDMQYNLDILLEKVGN